MESRIEALAYLGGDLGGDLATWLSVQVALTATVEVVFLRISSAWSKEPAK